MKVGEVQGPPVTFDGPVCVYKALTVDTAYPDEEIFKISSRS